MTPAGAPRRPGGWWDKFRYLVPLVNVRTPREEAVDFLQKAYPKTSRGYGNFLFQAVKSSLKVKGRLGKKNPPKPKATAYNKPRKGK
jgi:hypothetical protein